MIGPVETICFRVTKKCNLTCRRCWADASPVDTIHIRKTDIIAFCEHQMAFGLRNVSISGGEPALYSKISDLVSDLLSYKLSLTITTNATVTPSLISLLESSNIKPTRHLKIRVSLDGDEKKHDYYRGKGTYKIVLREIKRIKEWAGWVGINTVVDGLWNAIHTMGEELTMLDVDDWALMTPVPRGRYKTSHFDKKNALKELSYCANRIRTLAYKGTVHQWDYLSHPNGGVLIDADGTVLLPGVIPSEDITIGNIQKVTPLVLNTFVRERLRTDPIAFFHVSE